MNANVEETPRRQFKYPTEVKVDEVHRVEEALVRMREGDVRNRCKLRANTRLARAIGVATGFIGGA